MKAKYVNPFTDFGFKKIFGEEASKPLLLDFLNALLSLESPIKDLSFRNGEQLGQTEVDRKSIYDIYCENERGEKFIVDKLKNQNGKTFYEKLTYVYLEMPNFNKQEDELVTRLDKWLYFIKHLEDFQSIPQIFEGEVVFEKAL